MGFKRQSAWPFLIGATLLLVLPARPTLGPSGREESQQSEVARHASQASAATERRDFTKAEEEWRKVLALDSRSAQAYHNLGLVYYLQHKYPEAETCLGKALRLDPSLVNARVLLGASLVREGELERGITELEQALKLRLSESGEKTARAALYEALSARENYTQALDVLKPLVEKYPQDADLLYDLGQTYLQLSAQAFRKIMLVDPQSSRVHQILADSLAKQGHYREAIHEYQLALQQKPDLPGVHYQIGTLYRAYDNTPAGERAAIQEFEAELKANPYDAWSEYRLGLIDWKRHDVQNADSHFRRALQIDKALVPARIAVARLLETKGELEKAEEQLKLAEKLDPGNPTAHYRLAQIYKQRGDERASGEELRKFEEIQAGQRATERELEGALRREARPETDETLDERNQ